MAQVCEKLDQKRDLYASLFGDESDDDYIEDRGIEEVSGGTSDEEKTKTSYKIDKQQQAYDFSEARLEFAANKLRNQYQSLSAAKRQRKIQVLKDTPLLRRLQKPKKIVSRRFPKYESRLCQVRVLENARDCI